MPKISIFSSNFNKEKFIASTIESVLAQDFVDFEYLIVDDGSSDKSVEVIEKYCKKDSRIKFWNRGKRWLTDQYRFLLSQISKETEFITWIDTDDEYLPESLSIRLETFKKYPDCVLVYNNLLHVWPTGEVLDRHYPEKFEKYFFWTYRESIQIANIFHLLAYYDEIHPLSFWSLMFRRDYIVDLWILNASKNTWYFMWDLDLFYQTVAKYPSYWILEKILRYRVHPEQTLSCRTEEISQDSWYMLRDLFNKGMLSKNDYLKIRSR